jgi:phosphoglycolate phosphatase
MILPYPKAVIFDWDNTLVDTWPVIHDAINATLIEMGHEPWTFEQTKMRVRKSMRDSFPELFGENWHKAAEIYQAQYRARHLKSLNALPRAAEVLAQVKNKRLFSVVVSNKKGPNLRQEVKHLGWSGFFDTIVGADDAPRDKPHADPVHLAFEKSHLKPGPHVWFIGDSEVDLECAHATGCTAILYGDLTHDNPHYTATQFLGQPYDLHVHSHADTLQVLKAYA